jgi:uncharacterized protein YndB with AHSA1/START domain
VPAALRREGALFSLRFERHLHHPIERVWHAISDPAELERWFPSAVEIELVLGGTVTFAETGLDIDPTLVATRGTVIALEPPHLLAFTWGDEPLRFELRGDDEGGCVLTFTHEFVNRAGAARFAAGWSVCLERLAGALDPAASPAGSWDDYYARYEGEFSTHGAFARERGAGILRFERLLDVPAPAVWAALTEPAQLGKWLARAHLEGRVGGAVELRFDAPPGYTVTGTVTRFDPPRVLEYSWTAPGEPDGTVTWQLIPMPDRCVLLFTHTVRGEWDEAGTLAAWELHLARLASVVGGMPVAAFAPDHWERLAAEYRATIRQSG